MGFYLAGYGNQCSLFAPRLAEHVDLAVSAFYGLGGSRLVWNGIPIYPGLDPTYGNEVIQAHARAHFGGDLRGGTVLTLMDVWVLKPEIWRTMNVAAWCPVDHEPPPPLVKQFFGGSGAVPIAMSRFGEEQLAEFDPLYVPHGVDTAIYRPHDPQEARRAVGLPEEAFIVGVVAANKGVPSRKCFPAILQAFAAFRQRHSDAVLYLHTEMSGRCQGISLPVLVKSLGLPEGSVLFTDQYRVQFDPYSPALMSQVYSAFDVLLNPSAGEGFGLAPLEAQASGTPAIVTDFSAMKEVCGVGWKVEYEPEWTGQLSWQARPKVEDILVALEQCYGLSSSLRQELSEQAVEHASQYSADRVLKEHFLPALEQVTERFVDREPVELRAA